jgi:SAM-dependent methyltransferase
MSAIMMGRMTDTPSWDRSSTDREHFRGTFDDDADAYDRTRPVCPPAVFDDVVELGGLGAESHVLEIGPGTGQATRPLAERRIAVTAVELGPALADRTALNLAAFDKVQVINTSFEAFDPGGARFDAVFACNSFHWIDPGTRYTKAADLLFPRGHLIVVSTPWVVPDDADKFWWDVQDDWQAVGGREDPTAKHPDRFDLPLAGLAESGCFAEAITRRTRFDVAFTTEDYVTNLRTQSGFKEFEGPVQRALIERIRRRIDQHGGRIRAHLLAILTVAPLEPSSSASADP